MRGFCRSISVSAGGAVHLCSSFTDHNGRHSAHQQEQRRPEEDIARIAGLGRTGSLARRRNLHGRLFITADRSFPVLGARLGCGGFLIRHPLEGVGDFVQLFAALAGIPMVGFIGMPARSVGGVLRQLRNDRIFKGNFFRTSFIAEILITAVTVPVFDIAHGHMGCRFRFCFHKICVVGSIYFPVFLAADAADRLICAGGRAAVVLTLIAAFRAYAVFPFVCFF